MSFPPPPPPSISLVEVVKEEVVEWGGVAPFSSGNRYPPTSE